MNEENKNTPEICQNCPNGNLNTHFTLAVIAVILSCFTGFLPCFTEVDVTLLAIPWTIPLALAALILSLRTQDLKLKGHTEKARKTAWWAELCGWLTVLFALIPITVFLFLMAVIVPLYDATTA